MKTPRTLDDICLLCLNNKADKKGSHYSPAGIIKRVIGERDYEEIYSINSTHALTSVFYGRSNLLNSDTAIKKPEHTDDYIFCTNCEKKLGIIEGECNNKLITLSDNLIKGNLEIKITKAGNKYFSFKNPNRNVLIVFFYSIIWRQCLQQVIGSQSIFISKEFQEILRGIIFKEIGKPLKEIEESKDFENYPKLEIVTSYHKGDHTKNFINPNPVFSNPYLFFIGPYDVLIFHSKNPTLDFETNTGLPQNLIDNDLRINESSESIIGIVNESLWAKVTKQLAEYEGNKYLQSMTNNLSKVTRTSYSYSQKILLQTANKLKPQFPDDYIKCLEIAYGSLLK